MKETVFILAVALLLFGCRPKTEGMTGDWESAPHQTEWGEVICHLSMRSDGRCTLRMSPTDDPDADHLVSEGKWRSAAQSSATIVWNNDKPDTRIRVSLVDPTNITVDVDGDAIRLRRMD